MKTEQFLRHYGITGNPFSEEDAQTDTVFKRGCLWKIHHPAWDKFFGSPSDPSTALIFGEKGSGKTALRLQATAELAAYNEAHPERARLRHRVRRLQPVPGPLPGGACAPATRPRR
jgi:type II secretory pathway predicted ATPase ExeA